MLKISFVFGFWFVICLSQKTLAASESRSDLRCRAQFAREFTKTPDDTDQGFVTDAVPMTVAGLITGYESGVFPWVFNKSGLTEWYSPRRRGVLFLDEAAPSQSDLKFIRQSLERGTYRVSFNEAFAQVIEECRHQHRERENGSRPNS